MSVVTMKELLEAGVHFGHRTRRWNPKMRPFIFTERSGVHIIDLQQTMFRLNEYASVVRDAVAKNGTILFVGTKRQAQASVRQEAERCRMPYINERWLGGTLTNWVTIKQRIDHLLLLERRMDAGEYNMLTKKERLTIQREIDKLNRRIGGLKTMSRLPTMVFVVDTNVEDLAVNEANKLKIPVMAMVDTNSNPDLVEYAVPSNDDAIRAVKLIVSIIADAAEEGQRIREVDMAETGQVSQEDLMAMEQYLGPSTLAKLQAAEDELDEELDGLNEMDFDVVDAEAETDAEAALDHANMDDDGGVSQDAVAPDDAVDEVAPVVISAEEQA